MVSPLLVPAQTCHLRLKLPFGRCCSARRRSLGRRGERLNFGLTVMGIICSLALRASLSLQTSQTRIQATRLRFSPTTVVSMLMLIHPCKCLSHPFKHNCFETWTTCNNNKDVNFQDQGSPQGHINKKNHQHQQKEKSRFFKAEAAGRTISTKP